MRLSMTLVLSFSLLALAGCGDDEGTGTPPPPPPGSSPDGGGMDAAGGPIGGDARPSEDSGSPPPMTDAVVPRPGDAAPPRPGDSGAGPMAIDLCVTLCPRIAMCFPVPPGDCADACAGLVGTCAESELGAVRACIDRPMSCMALQTCLVAVDCLAAFFDGVPGM